MASDVVYLKKKHVKTGQEMLSAEKFDKKALVTTKEGKSVISAYLAANSA